MKDYIYALYNVLSKRYESIMSFPSDGMALHRLSGRADKKEYELCRIGEYDINSGVATTYAPIRLIWENEEELPKTESK